MLSTITKKEYEIISPSECHSPRYFDELHHFALTDKGREVLTAGPNWIKTKNHVGVIQTMSGLVLEILPKIYKDENSIEDTRRDFIAMLRVMRYSESYKEMDFARLRPSAMPQYELFISMFISEVNTILKKGIKSNYVIMEENLVYLKGKLVAGEHIRRNSIHKEQFYVSYDEYLHDIPRNRIIKSAICYLRNRSRSFLNMQQLSTLQIIFDNIRESHNPEVDYSIIINDRTNDYYARALAWAMLFLGGKSFAAYSGNTIAFALLFPMEKVFESYVYHCLKKSEQLQEVRYQGPCHYMAKEDTRDIFRMKPDITAHAKNKNVLYIIDAKWKLVDQWNREEKYGVSQGDMYQLLSYAKIYGALEQDGVKVVTVLVYPETSAFSEIKEFTYQDSNNTGMVLLPLNIHESLHNRDYRFPEMYGVFN